ncbi:restriction endonuclease subunit S [Lactococcus formosensis]|uniref:restriction endonuclease subunit S n=1 Tax=Lactococcus formosensis TaxID=1281486 RepID=UPI00254E4E28|nr:restriction endonuclease subunit S [Lactococcus formosensis]
MSEKMRDSGVSWIGEIPEGWETSEIQYKFEQVKRKNIGNQEKNLLSLSYGKIIQKDIEKSIGLLPESFETYNIIENGDIVFRLTDLQNDQRSLRVGLAKEKGIITSAYQTIRPKNSGEIDSRYFFYLFYDYDIQKVFYGMGAGVRQGLTFEELKRLKIIVPKSLSEQKTIADHLDKQSQQFDQATNLLKAEIAQLRAYKKSLIYETVTKGLDKNVQFKDSGVDWIGEIPEDWEVGKTKYFFDIFAGGDISESELSKEPDELHYIPVLSNSKENHGIFGYSNKSRFGKGSFTVTGRGDVGYAEPRNYDYYPVIRLLIGVPKKEMDNRFAAYWINTAEIDRNQTAIPQMTRQTLGEVPFPSILFSEQKAIADYLDEKIHKINEILQIKELQLRNIAEQRKTLIYEVVTGKRRGYGI